MHQRRIAIWFLLPWLIGLVGLTLLPSLLSLTASFFRVNGPPMLSGATWVGATNYQTALASDDARNPAKSAPWIWRRLGFNPVDPRFHRAMLNTVVYTVFVVPISLTIALLVALLLNQPLRGGTVFRALVYLPHLLGGVATVVIWSWLLNPQFGWINHGIRGVYTVLNSLGFADVQGWPVPDWLYSLQWCKPALVLIHSWTMGGAMLVFLAALQRVPAHLYDAALVDGAGRWSRFRHVTLPQITPALLFNLIIAIIFAMQTFNESYLLQNRSQGDGLLFFVPYLYETAFRTPFRFGYACALAWIFMIVVMLMIVPVLWSARRWVYYAGGR